MRFKDQFYSIHRSLTNQEANLFTQQGPTNIPLIHLKPIIKKDSYVYVYYQRLETYVYGKVIEVLKNSKYTIRVNLKQGLPPHRNPTQTTSITFTICLVKGNALHVMIPAVFVSKEDALLMKQSTWSNYQNLDTYNFCSLPPEQP